MDSLAGCIIRAFDFDGDHLYAFDLVVRDGRRMQVQHPYMEDADVFTDELAIRDLPLDEQQAMTFQYDFGANWEFNVTLEKIEPDGAKISKPTIVESHGRAPAEYEYDEEW
jgi:hypothetical protein